MVQFYQNYFDSTQIVFFFFVSYERSGWNELQLEKNELRLLRMQAIPQTKLSSFVVVAR